MEFQSPAPLADVSFHEFQETGEAFSFGISASYLELHEQLNSPKDND
jgi:hypothetical protein